MSVAGIIFSNLHDRNMSELTRMRTLASVPFGCRYRLIDFALSNMVNSGITHIGVIAHENYQSLMDHIGSGKDWDLARRNGGIKILPPYITAFASKGSELHDNRLESLKNIVDFIVDCPEEYIVLSDSDVICNFAVDDMIARHIACGADATLAVKRCYVSGDTKNTTTVKFDDDGRMTDIAEMVAGQGGFVDVALKIWVMRRKFLLDMLYQCIAHDYTSFEKDLVLRNLDFGDFRVYRYDGYFAKVGSMSDYFLCNMDLLNSDTRKELFGAKNRPILTKVRNSAPTVYSADAVVLNSLIADGCVIEGTVENSILFRGVKIGKNTHVKNSILFQDTFTGSNVQLNCVITDKNVIIRDGRNLSGHETRPFYIEKNAHV